MRMFKRKYKYKFGRVEIKSEIPLEENEISFIIETINKITKNGLYEPCYHISREICHEFSTRVSRVETYYYPRKMKVNILKY